MPTNLRSAKSKAESILKPQGTKTPVSGLSPSKGKGEGIEATLNGLSSMTINDVGAAMTPFSEGEFKVTDVRNTGHLPQASVQEHSASMANMQGAIRLLELQQESAKVTGKTFDVLKERAVTFGKGVQAVTQIEKVKGEVFKYQEQVEQNGILGLRVDSKKAEHAAYSQQVGYDKQSFLQKVEQARLSVATMEVTLEQSREKLKALGITPTQTIAAKPVK